MLVTSELQIHRVWNDLMIIKDTEKVEVGPTWCSRAITTK